MDVLHNAAVLREAGPTRSRTDRSAPAAGQRLTRPEKAEVPLPTDRILSARGRGLRSEGRCAAPCLRQVCAARTDGDAEGAARRCGRGPADLAVPRGLEGLLCMVGKAGGRGKARPARLPACHRKTMKLGDSLFGASTRRGWDKPPGGLFTPN